MSGGKTMILGMGNPLLDISANVEESMLAKYNLNANDAILYEKEDVFEDMTSKYSVDFIAGGATQNSCRVAQWILGEERNGETAYFGCVGTDDTSKTLEKVAKEAGVNVVYQKSSDHPTGKCAVLITAAGQARSLVTKLDAANHFTIDHLNIKENWDIVESAKVFYSAGFFLTVCPDAMIKVAKHASETGKHFGMNLSAPFLCQFFKEPMQKVMAYSNLVFGNEDEAEAFAEHNGLDTKDRKVIAKKIADLPLEGHAGRSRIVVITQGSDNVIVVENGEVKEYDTIKLAASDVVDTNGAGDAFVGGFLAQLANGKSIAECVKCGVWTATEIIKLSGCTCPKDKKYQA